MKAPVTCLAMALVIGSLGPLSASAEEKKDVLDDLKCFIMTKRTVKGKKVYDYKGAKLYLCCGACVSRMKRTPEKYEAKANHQIVQTGQFTQKACPLSGDAVTDSSPSLKIGGVAVKFSKAEHKDKVAKLEADKQLDTVFGKDGFKKGKFEPAKKEKK